MEAKYYPVLKCHGGQTSSFEVSWRTSIQILKCQGRQHLNNVILVVESNESEIELRKLTNAKYYKHSSDMISSRAKANVTVMGKGPVSQSHGGLQYNHV